MSSAQKYSFADTGGSLLVFWRLLFEKPSDPIAMEKVKYENLRRLVPFIAPYSRSAIVALVLTMLSSGATTLQPLISKYLIDDVIYHRHMDLFFRLVLAAAGLILGSAIMSYYQSVAMTRFQLSALANIQDQLLSKVLKLPKSFFDSKHTGYLISRILQDTSRLQNFFSSNIVSALQQIIILPFAVGFLCWLNWRLVLIMMAMAPLLVWVSHWTTARSRRTSRILYEKSAAVWRELASTLGAVALIKTFGTEGQERKKFSRSLQDSVDAGLQQSAFSTGISLVLSLITSAVILMCTWRGVWDVYLFRMSIGDYVAFCGYMGYVLGPLQSLTQTYVGLQAGMVSLDRVVEIAESVPEDSADLSNVEIHQIRGKVEFNAVSFGYDPHKQVLHNVSFKVEPGEVVAIVGPSGSGKSTLVSLLIRLYRPTSGQILMDGRDVEEIKLSGLRERIGIVSQDVLLLDDTIVNNIRYGRPNATFGEIEHAAELACAARFIRELPEGFNTIVGERGVRLSAGERQRISLARVLTRGADLVILDEPTAALDSETEEAVKRALSVSLAGKTTFIVAHRLATVIAAHRILVLRDGRIEQIGTHAELKEQPGLYATMCRQQLLSVPEIRTSEPSRGVLRLTTN